MIVVALVIGAIYLKNSRNLVEAYETLAYNTTVYQAELFATDLCVTNEEVEFESFYTNDDFPGALLFNLKEQEILYAEHVHERLYPASTTKLMTTYLALKYGKLSDMVTVSKKAVDVPSDSSKAYLEVGDQLTLEDLLYSLMLPSGNDSAIAVAEHISGTTEEFVQLMNEEVQKIGATNTHFMNPHGYHDDEHYTTAYDLYLILNECIKYDEFVELISATKRAAVITEADGTQRNVTWSQSNKFVNGSRDIPKGVTIIGGKTGTTYEAGYCLVLYGKDSAGTPYISVIMGSTSSRNLYDNMYFLWAAIP